jgi:hypothetical protein
LLIVFIDNDIDENYILCGKYSGVLFWFFAVMLRQEASADA